VWAPFVRFEDWYGEQGTDGEGPKREAAYRNNTLQRNRNNTLQRNPFQHLLCSIRV